MKRNSLKAHRFLSILTALVMAAALTPSAAAQAITADWFVDGATGSDTSNDGESWAQPFETLQKALEEAELAGGAQVIFIAAGTYYPDEIDGGDSDDRDDAFALVEDVAVYGGFLNGDDFDDRDPENNITILSGDIDQNDGPDPFEDNDNNSYHVVTADGVGNTTILNGFWITAGNADDIFSPDNGGGGMLIFDASPIVVRSTFAGNFGASRGGAIHIPNDGSSSPIFVNCSFLSNTADGQGGGAVFFIDSSATFTNCLFSGNVGKTHGGALFAGGSTSVVTNCTFSGNSVTLTDGGGVHVMDGSATLANCVFWGNTPDQIHANSGTTSVSFSDVEGGIPAEVTDDGGNIDDDPEFVNVIAGNLRLLAFSPCIETADNDAIPDDVGDLDDDGDTFEETPYDLDLGDRVVDFDENMTAVVDMGAYESVPCPWDLDEGCFVGAGDLLILLANWGNPYGAAELLALLADWGPCPCDPMAVVLSLEEEWEDACLTEAQWDEYVDVMADPDSSQADKDRYDCWMTHYLLHCNNCTCEHRDHCPNPDPFN